MVKLVMVTGSGRSGTSSVAGTLKRLGLVIPQPEVKTDERNPRGYYEPSWVAIFHGKWMKAIPIRTIDARPSAGMLAMADVTPEREARLRTWLLEQVASLPRGATLLIKDTRAFWVYPLWQRVADEIGIEMVSLTMLRHPTQVVRSRDAAWLTHKGDAERVQRETANVAGWLNSIFVTERATRSSARAFVPYYDLVGDWRSAMDVAKNHLGIEFADTADPSSVDEFITPELNRSLDSWDGLTVPRYLQDLAEATWSTVRSLVAEPHGHDAMSRLDDLGDQYEAFYLAAVAIASDEIEAGRMHQRAKLQSKLDTKNERLAALRERLHQRQPAPGASGPPATSE